MTTTTQNPYASFLGTRDAKTVIAETPAKLKSLSTQITNLDCPPAPGKWSPKEILCHLAVFTAVRQWNITLIQNASPELLAKPVSHPERGEMTFQTIVETMGGHDTN